MIQAIEIGGKHVGEVAPRARGGWEYRTTQIRADGEVTVKGSSVWNAEDAANCLIWDVYWAHRLMWPEDDNPNEEESLMATRQRARPEP